MPKRLQHIMSYQQEKGLVLSLLTDPVGFRKLQKGEIKSKLPKQAERDWKNSRSRDRPDHWGHDIVLSGKSYWKEGERTWDTSMFLKFVFLSNHCPC